MVLARLYQTRIIELLLINHPPFNDITTMAAEIGKVATVELIRELERRLRCAERTEEK
jgi:hypothetical protein